MKKCRRKLFKKMVCLVMVCAICSQLCGITAFAGTVPWNLHYSPAGTPQEYVSSWSKSVIATKSTTSVTVSRVGGGATIHVYSSNGINKSFSGAGSASCPAVVGRTITLKVFYVNGGTPGGSASGYFSY